MASALAVIVQDAGAQSMAARLLQRFQAELRAEERRDASQVGADDGFAWLSQLHGDVLRLFVERVSRSIDDGRAAVLWELLLAIKKRLRLLQSAETRRYRLDAPKSQRSKP